MKEYLAFVCASILLLVGWHASDPPADFTTTEVASGLAMPTDKAFLPSGDLLVAEKGQGDSTNGISTIRLIRNGDLLHEPVLALETNPYGDSGILGLVLDPGFAENGYFYVWYATRGNENRIARFTFDPLTDRADSETVILDGIPWSMRHNGGGMAFDQDGFLYVAIGDIERPSLVQQLGTWNGKLLRLDPRTPDNPIPPDNPYVGQLGAIPAIYARGLRSPFRITVDPVAGTLYLADVGENSWEEINTIQIGANYGWPVREGPCPRGARDCQPEDSGYTDPVVYYPHDDGRGGITALSFYQGDAYPALYRNALYFADSNANAVYVVRQSARGRNAGHPEIHPFLENVGAIVDIEVHQGALYLCDIYRGVIWRVDYNAGGLPPINLSADPVQGSAPLPVAFTAQSEAGDEEQPLTYQWDFGDQTSQTTASPHVTHTYSTDGTYVATLRVGDPEQSTAREYSTRITVYSGEIAQIQVENQTEPGRPQFHGGDTFQFEATRADGMQGLDPERPYTWQINLMHNQHHHPVIAGHDGISRTLSLSRDNHGGKTDIWYQIELLMRTDTGQLVSATRQLRPELVDLTIDTHPQGARVDLNGVSRATPLALPAIIGTEQEIGVPNTFISQADGWIYQFAHWQIVPATQSANRNHTLKLIVSEIPTSYTAFYERLRESNRVFLPGLTRGDPQELRHQTQGAGTGNGASAP